MKTPTYHQRDTWGGSLHVRRDATSRSVSGDSLALTVCLRYLYISDFMFDRCDPGMALCSRHHHLVTGHRFESRAMKTHTETAMAVAAVRRYQMQERHAAEQRNIGGQW